MISQNLLLCFISKRIFNNTRKQQAGKQLTESQRDAVYSNWFFSDPKRTGTPDHSFGCYEPIQESLTIVPACGSTFITRNNFAIIFAQTG